MRMMNAETYQNVMDALRQAADERAERELGGASFVQESDLYECASVSDGKVYLLHGYKEHDVCSRIVIAAYGATATVANNKGIKTHPYFCNDIEREITKLASRKQREGYDSVRVYDTESHQAYALQEIAEREFFAMTPAGQKAEARKGEISHLQIVNDENESGSSDTGENRLRGTVVGGGWERDVFNNSCPRVHITINAHHLAIVDDTERGWILYDFDGAPDTNAAFQKCFGAVFGEDAEFEYDVLRDFVRMLERVGSERIADVYRGKQIMLSVEYSPN